MTTLIQNPRRSPRAPVRCEARIASEDGGFWASATSDYGPRGCRVVSPLPLAPGARVSVQLANERVAGTVELAGRVAWTTREPPGHIGITFEAGSFDAAGGFFDHLAAAYPGMDPYGRAPDRIPEDAPLAPAPPPPFKPLLTESEAKLIDGIGAGAPAAALRAIFRADFELAARALFALLGRRYLVIGPPDPAAAAAWARLRGRST
jgi:hypothetical protein